jgi:hypothetical protein
MARPQLHQQDKRDIAVKYPYCTHILSSYLPLFIIIPSYNLFIIYMMNDCTHNLSSYLFRNPLAVCAVVQELRLLHGFPRSTLNSYRSVLFAESIICAFFTTWNGINIIIIKSAG